MNKKESIYCLCAGLIAILTFCVVTNIWIMDLNVPINYAGDLSGLLVNAKSVLRDEPWWAFDALGAPFQTNMWRQLMDAAIPSMIIYMIAGVTDSIGYGINIYYILSFGLSGSCAYYMLRKANIEQRFSLVGAVIYALIPGHIQRNIGHLFVGSCFSIPLILVAAMRLMHGQMCRDEYKGKKKLSAKELVKSNSREQYFGILFLIVVSLCTIYYGIFALMLLTFCTVYCVFTHKQLRHFYYYAQYVLVEIVCAGIIYTPQFIANKFDPRVETIDIVSRTLGDVEQYAGKFIQYILPVTGHRLPFLSNLRELYNSSFPLVNENGMSSLGFIMSVGFITGILVCFFHKEKISAKLEIYGKIELFLFFVSTVGGLGAFVGLINYNLRCYNRFSYFIGAAGIIISMKLLQEFCICLGVQKLRKNMASIVTYGLCVLVLVIGIFDQTTIGMKYTKEYAQNITSRYRNDFKFVNEIEQYESSEANILVFPVMNGQQAATGYTKDGYFTNYTEQMLFIHSETSNWSTGSKAGEAGERWLNWLESYDVKEQVEIAAIVGFSGIAVDYEAYEASNLDILSGKLHDIFGEPTIIHDGNTWVYYSINKAKDHILAGYSDQEREQLRYRYLYHYNESAFNNRNPQ